MPSCMNYIVRNSGRLEIRGINQTWLDGVNRERQLEGGREMPHIWEKFSLHDTLGKHLISGADRQIKMRKVRFLPASLQIFLV